MNLESLLRDNIRFLKPYSSARDEFKGEASVYLDANESPYNFPYNRYPDPLQWKLKEKVSELRSVPPANIFLGNGSDEAIDLIYRIFCEPGEDNVVAIEPTYGMYRVCADINNIGYRTVELNEKSDIEAYRIMDATNQKTKVIWLCSPNNPTGNDLNPSEIIKLLQWFRGIVVIDEAYVDFSERDSLSILLSRFSNLIILQTMSKAWASAGARLGMAFASKEMIEIFNKVKYPYNISALTQEYALKMFERSAEVSEWIAQTLSEREKLSRSLKKMDIVKKVYPSEANFLLVEVDDANYIYKILVDKGVIVRNRNNVTLCKNCIRITVGSPDENAVLVREMKLIQ